MNRMLAEILARVDKPTETWSSPDGSTVLLLPYGGRILGLFAPGCVRNFLWTHPSLNSVDSANTFYQSKQWHNSGGDRTWLSPEIDFFLPHFPKLDIYIPPREFDPGNYQLIRENGYIAMMNRFTVQLSRSKQTVDLEVTKRVTPASNPLRHLKSSFLRSLKYAGYTLHTRLKFVNCRTDPVTIGLWNLLQLPHGGELVMPTFSRSMPEIYMGCIDERDLVVTDHLIRYKMRAIGEHKLGIRAPTAIGRVGYLYSTGEDASLVIRNFLINPSGEYVDVPWMHTDHAGSAIQGCNVNSKLGTFSELEYHVPAINGLDGGSHCEDESQLWAFSGSTKHIFEVARFLISHDL